jgi:hypothetical protein
MCSHLFCSRLSGSSTNGISSGGPGAQKGQNGCWTDHKYARVVRIHNGTDGMVWLADIKYKLPGEKF